MIKVTKLNKETFILNALFIERIEATPDSVITLTNDKKFIVRESIEEINSLVTEFYQKINLFQVMKEVNNHDE
ncbi:flagellar FlbD family protein [Bacillus horti]|uniref:Flagellar protein FlbD n=1 Tax=Caldalkalibacillus horti TaxID=77523 RepID=A0ABT9VVK7_9BACI|nr:flagellar FlbD family protein [Bacillus horti]MDQ0164670.1 flagellar protein FlbD [Bacillus horti]